jgi:hypothetical protein
MKNVRCFATTIAALSLALAPAIAFGRVETVAKILYNNPQRMFFESFVPDPKHKGALLWKGGNITPERRIAEEDRDFFAGEVTMDRAHDCSDGQYRCVYGHYAVFAVPRAGLRPNSSFQAGGASLRVEQCMRGDKEVCQVALVSSDCQSIAAPDRCTPVSGGRSAGASVGRVRYFIFNEDFGITSYGSSSEPVSTPERQKEVAFSMVLRSDHGLLFESPNLHSSLSR